MIDIHGAGHRYKEITGRATDAIAAYRRDNERLLADLTERLAEAQAAIDEAERTRAEVEKAVDMRWDSVLEALFSERWLRMGTRPVADDTRRSDTDLREHKRELQRAFDELHAASRRQGWLRRKR